MDKKVNVIMQTLCTISGLFFGILEALAIFVSGWAQKQEALESDKAAKVIREKCSRFWNIIATHSLGELPIPFVKQVILGEIDFPISVVQRLDRYKWATWATVVAVLVAIGTQLAECMLDNQILMLVAWWLIAVIGGLLVMGFLLTLSDRNSGVIGYFKTRAC